MKAKVNNRLAIIGGWLSVLVLATGCLYLLSYENKPANMAALLLAVVLPPIIMAGNTYREFIASSRQQSYIGISFITGFLAAWIPWKLIEDSHLYNAEPLRAYLAVGLIIVLLILTGLGQFISNSKEHVHSCHFLRKAIRL